MIDKANVLNNITDRLKKMHTGHYLDICTYKRNRSVVIIKIDEQNLKIIEDGYENEVFDIKLEKLSKLFKVLLKREFPRSNKIRIYSMGQYNPDRLKGNERKKI